MNKSKKFWRLWCKALGQKASNDDTESDNVAYIRTAIFVTYFVTNIFIVAGVIRHWNDSPVIEIFIETPSPENYGNVRLL